MLLRFILWIIVIFIAGKIAGSVVRYVRHLLTPNKDIASVKSKNAVEKYTDVQDVPYEEVPKSKE